LFDQVRKLGTARRIPQTMSQREKKKLGWNEEHTTLNGKVESAELWKPASAQQWRFFLLLGAY
jgi:hypothetical protein